MDRLDFSDRPDVAVPPAVVMNKDSLQPLIRQLPPQPPDHVFHGSRVSMGELFNGFCATGNPHQLCEHFPFPPG